MATEESALPPVSERPDNSSRERVPPFAYKGAGFTFRFSVGPLERTGTASIRTFFSDFPQFRSNRLSDKNSRPERVRGCGRVEGSLLPFERHRRSN